MRNSLIISMLDGKCPQCRDNHMFLSHPYDISKLGKMHKCCDKCGLEYEREPGFFYGAMYVSYAFSVGIFLVTGFILYHFFNDPPTLVYIITVTSIVFVTYPLLLRYSRIVYLYAFGDVKYKRKAE